MANKNSKKTKKSSRIPLSILIIITLIGAVSAQVWFNHFQNQRIDGIYTWQFKSMTKDAMDALYETSDKVNDDGLIPEANLKIDQTELEQYDKIAYRYDDEDKTGQITSFFNHTYGVNGSLNGIEMEELMDSIPNAQACVRGFTIALDKEVEENDGLSLISTKKLADGRNLNIYRETRCNSPNMDNLEKVIKTTESS